MARGSGTMASSLGKMAQSELNDEERLALRRKYWERDGVLVLYRDEMIDDFDRQWAANLAAKLFQTGKTKREPAHD